MRTEKKAGIFFITLDRVEIGNSLNPETLIEFRQTLIGVQTDPKVRVIVITGDGEKDFCTGMDVKAGSNLSAENRLNLANLGGDIVTLIYQGKPTIVALNGRTMGMGVLFSVAADYRIAVEDVILQMPEINASIFPNASCNVIMNRVCGQSWTRKILMLGEPITTKEAIKANIVDEVVSREELMKRVFEIARIFKKKNPELLKTIKKAIVGCAELSYEDGVNIEMEYSKYYTWKNPEDELNNLNSKYSLKFPLTGDPELMKKEINNYSE